VGTARRLDRQEVVVRALHERSRVRAVDVPQEDVHETRSVTATRAGTAAASASHRSATTTSAGCTDARHGCPGTGHTRARQPAHGIDWSPSPTCGTRHGCQRRYGTVGA